MKDLIHCPICFELFNHLTRVPFVSDCGAVCCKTCLQIICVFCAENHKKPAQEFLPFLETLKKIVLICVNHQKTADFIENSTFLPYCQECRAGKQGTLMQDDLFQNFLDDRLLQLSQMINQEFFVSVHREIVKEKTAEEKLKLIRALMQFVKSTGFCFFHHKLKAIAVDKDLRFRCGFCEEADVVFLNNVDECRSFAHEFVRNNLWRVKESLNDLVIDRNESVVQIFIEISYWVNE